MADPTVDEYELPSNIVDMDDDQLRALAEALFRVMTTPED